MASVDEPGIASVLLQASDRTGQYSDQGEQTSSYRTFSKNSNRDPQSDNLSETELVTNAKVQVAVYLIRQGDNNEHIQDYEQSWPMESGEGEQIDLRQADEQLEVPIRQAYTNEQLQQDLYVNGWFLTIHYITESTLFSYVNFLFALVLILLGFWEQSAVSPVYEDQRVYLAIETVSLIAVAVCLILRSFKFWSWKKNSCTNFFCTSWRNFFGNNFCKNFFFSRVIVIMVVLVVMFVEVVVMLSTDYRHFRIMRALRPLLLLDTYLMTGARRIIKQIFLCSKYITDVLLVLFFLIAVAALMGYFLFASTDPTYYATLSLSFVSTVIAVTTANLPDIFMESYLKNSATPIFYIIFFAVTSYTFINLLLVVLVKFKHEADKEFQSLFLHRRKALRLSYELLKDSEDGVTWSVFFKLMRSYQPQLADHEILCIFKKLSQETKFNNMRTPVSAKSVFTRSANSSTSQCVDKTSLKMEQFERLHHWLGLRWELVEKSRRDVHLLPWYWSYCSGHNCYNCYWFMQYVHSVIYHRLFNTFFMYVIVANLLFLCFVIIDSETGCSYSEKQLCLSQNKGGLIGSFVFTILYVLEVTTRLSLDGARIYFGRWWNWFDFVVVYGSFICLCLESSLQGLYWVPYLVIVRPVKLIRVLRLRHSTFLLIRIMRALTYRLSSIVILLMCVMYFYAVIGMEVFGTETNRVYPGCCMNASYGVGAYYLNESSTAESPDIYWLNNFNNLYSSVVTLFELMMVNNWFIIMEGFVSTTSSTARIYFILFWVTNLVVLNVSTGYLLEGFELSFENLSKGSNPTKNKLCNKLCCCTRNDDNDDNMEELENYICDCYFVNDMEIVEITEDDKRNLKKASAGSPMKCPYYGIKRWWRSAHLSGSDGCSVGGIRELTDKYLTDLKYESKGKEWINLDYEDDSGVVECICSNTTKFAYYLRYVFT